VVGGSEHSVVFFVTLAGGECIGGSGGICW